MRGQTVYVLLLDGRLEDIFGAARRGAEAFSNACVPHQFESVGDLRDRLWGGEKLEGVNADGMKLVVRGEVVQ